MDLILIDFMSLDGVVQAPGAPDEDRDGGFAHGGWSGPYFDVDVMGPAIDAVVQRTDALLYGRRTWEVMAAHWPTRSADEDPFTTWINGADKHVASRTLSAEDVSGRWTGSQLLPGDDALAAVRDLKASRDGGLQVWGSSELARQLVAADLVDEYVLLLEPVLLGGGKGVFPQDGAKRELELVSVEQAKTGTLVCTYRRAG